MCRAESSHEFLPAEAHSTFAASVSVWCGRGNIPQMERDEKEWRPKDEPGLRNRFRDGSPAWCELGSARTTARGIHMRVQFHSITIALALAVAAPAAVVASPRAPAAGLVGSVAQESHEISARRGGHGVHRARVMHPRAVHHRRVHRVHGRHFHRRSYYVRHVHARPYLVRRPHWHCHRHWRHGHVVRHCHWHRFGHH